MHVPCIVCASLALTLSCFILSIFHLQNHLLLTSPPHTRLLLALITSNCNQFKQRQTTMDAQEHLEVAEGDDGSLLLDLPAEIRNIIYDEVLVSSAGIGKHNYKQPGLRRVNRQIRREALPNLLSPEQLPDQLPRLRQQSLASIPHAE